MFPKAKLPIFPRFLEELAEAACQQGGPEGESSNAARELSDHEASTSGCSNGGRCDVAVVLDSLSTLLFLHPQQKVSC